MKKKKLYSKPEMEIVRLESAIVLGPGSFDLSDEFADEPW